MCSIATSSVPSKRVSGMVWNRIILMRQSKGAKSLIKALACSIESLMPLKTMYSKVSRRCFAPSA